MDGSERAGAVHAPLRVLGAFARRAADCLERAQEYDNQHPECQLFSPNALLALLERSGRGEGIVARLEGP